MPSKNRTRPTRPDSFVSDAPTPAPEPTPEPLPGEDHPKIPGVQETGIVPGPRRPVAPRSPANVRVRTRPEPPGVSPDDLVIMLDCGASHLRLEFASAAEMRAAVIQIRKRANTPTNPPVVRTKDGLVHVICNVDHAAYKDGLFEMRE